MKLHIMIRVGKFILHFFILIFIEILYPVSAWDTEIIKLGSHLQTTSNVLRTSAWFDTQKLSSYKLEMSQKLSKFHLNEERNVTFNVQVKGTSVKNFPSKMQIVGNLWMCYPNKRNDIKHVSPDFLSQKNYSATLRRQESVHPGVNVEQWRLLGIITTIKPLTREVSGERIASKTPEDAQLISNKTDIAHSSTLSAPALGLRGMWGLVEATPLISVGKSENVHLKDEEIIPGKISEQTVKRSPVTEHKDKMFHISEQGGQKFIALKEKDKSSHTLRRFTENCATPTTSVNNVRIRRNAKSEEPDQNIPGLEPNRENILVVDAEPSNRARIFSSVTTEKTQAGELEQYEGSTELRPNGQRAQDSNMKGFVIHNNQDIPASAIAFFEQENHTQSASVVNSSETSAENQGEDFHYQANSHSPDAYSYSNNAIVKDGSTSLVINSLPESISPTVSTILVRTDIIVTSSHKKVDNIEPSIIPTLVGTKYYRQSSTNRPETTPFESLYWSRKYKTVTAHPTAHVRMSTNVDTSTSSFTQARELYQRTKPESSKFAANEAGSAVLQSRSDSSTFSSVSSNSDENSSAIPHTDSGITDMFRDSLQVSKHKSKPLNSDIDHENHAIAVSESYPGQIEPAPDFDQAGHFTFPDWQAAKRSWRYAWEIHVYVLGCLFGLVQLYNMLSVVKLWQNQRLLPITYFLSMHTLIACLCFTRSVYLLYDGYNSKGTYHVSLNHFLYSVSFPCLTSAFSILLYWLLGATDMTIIPSSLQKMQVLIPVIVIHYLLSIAADVLAATNAGMQVMQFVCQVYFIAWGVFLFFGYAYIFRKLHSQAVKRQNQVKYCSSGTLCPSDADVTYELTLTTALKVTFLTAICGLAVVGLEIYSLVYTLCTRERPKPWPWWLYHTVLRLLELFMCLTMSYTFSLPFRYSLSRRKCLSGVLCSPFLEILSCSHSTKSSRPAKCSYFHQRFSFNSVHNDNIGSLSENRADNLLNNGCIDVIPMVDVQPVSDPLIIIDDVYVRFQTDHDINRIVDSFNDQTHKPESVHVITTSPKDDFLNNVHVSNNWADTSTYIDIDETNHTDESRNGSITNSDLFRVPSSVSIAESMEKELVRAFDSFKADSCKI